MFHAYYFVEIRPNQMDVVLRKPAEISGPAPRLLRWRQLLFYSHSWVQIFFLRQHLSLFTLFRARRRIRAETHRHSRE